MYSSDGFQKEWFNGYDAHHCIMLLRDHEAVVSRPLTTMEMAKFLDDISVRYILRLSITYSSTLNSLSTISNLVSTSIYSYTITLTYSSRLITFTTSTTTTATTLSHNSSNSLIQIHDPTLFPTFTSFKSKLQLYQLRNIEIKDLLNSNTKFVLKLWEKRLAFIDGLSKEEANFVSYSTLASN
eukprot:Awhi_evm1s11463